MHKRLRGIPILNGDVMDAPVQSGSEGLDNWFSTDIVVLEDSSKRPWCSVFMKTTGDI